MSDATLELPHPDQVPALLGARDQHLRRIRETLGANIFLRAGHLHFQGTDDQVQRGVAVFLKLQKVLKQHGFVTEADVADALGADGVLAAEEAPPPAIDLFEKARKVSPRTPGQGAYVQAIRENELVFCIGPAGCGKTYLAVAMAVAALRQEQVTKIVLVRPAVEAGEKLGYLPGDMLAKINPFLRPLLDALREMLDFEQVARYLEKDVIEIVPLAFMRGRTLNNTFIILDEAQNTTVTQMKMFLTRMGMGSRIVATGDITQIDLPPHVTSGLTDAVERLNSIEGVATVRLTGRDIVRHRLVREIVAAYDRPTHKGTHKPR